MEKNKKEQVAKEKGFVVTNSIAKNTEKYSEDRHEIEKKLYRIFKSYS